MIVPAHGPALDKQLIDANERYIADVYAAVSAAKAAGVGRGELRLPPARFLAAGVAVDLPELDPRRDGSGTALAQPVAAVAGSITG